MILIFDVIVCDNVGNKFIGNITIDMIGRQRWSIASILRYNCRSLKSPVKTFCKLFFCT